MRLAPSDLQTMQHVIFAELGQEGVHARLFGSRVKDDARGGDAGVRLLTPSMQKQPIDDVALSQGVPLLSQVAHVLVAKVQALT